MNTRNVNLIALSKTFEGSLGKIGSLLHCWNNLSRLDVKAESGQQNLALVTGRDRWQETALRVLCCVKGRSLLGTRQTLKKESFTRIFFNN